MLQALKIRFAKNETSSSKTMMVSTENATALCSLRILDASPGIGFYNVANVFPALRWLGTDWQALTRGLVPLARVPNIVLLKVYAAKVQFNRYSLFIAWQQPQPRCFL